MLANTNKLLVSFATVGLLLSCAVHDTDQAFQQALIDTSSENEQHATSCARSSSLQELASEMDRHEAQMPGLFGRMDTGFSDMGHCFVGDPNAMRGMMSGLRTRESSHQERMQAASSIADGTAECRDYADATRQDLQEMTGMMGTTRMHCM